MTSLPLDDHAAMYITASRRRHPPHVGVVRCFDDRIDADALETYAARLAANPDGFGRRVVPARIPGAKARWRPAHELPPLRVEAEPLDAQAIAALLDEEISTQPDPSRDAGWRLAAIPETAGGSVVLAWLHHAYGDGRGILQHAFAPAAEDAPPPRFGAPGRVEELGDVLARVRVGVAGTARLSREAALARWRRPHSDLTRLAPAVSALLNRDPSVGGRSERRVLALARTGAEDWDGAAAARGGRGNTLLLAVLANLLRLARRSRGEVDDRPLRLMLPVDTRPLRPDGGGWGAADAANAAAAAIVTLPGGAPIHGSLEEVRAAVRDALRRASAGAAPAGTRKSRPPGIVDAMELLPDAVTHRVASRVQAHADGVASNVGLVPPHVAQLGPFTAREVYLLAAPMLTDLAICLARHDDAVTLGVVADPARLGPIGHLRDRVAEELAGWSLDAEVR